MPRQRNFQLEGLLGELGFTHQDLADEVNRVAYGMFGGSPNCTDRHVRRWISGEVQWPWTKYLLPLQEIFGRSPEELGFVPRGASSQVPAPPQRPTFVKEPPVRRRDFITSGLTAALGIDAIPASGRLGTSDVDRIRRISPALYQYDHTLGGGALHTVAVDALAQVQGALDHCSYGDRVGQLLYAAAGDLAASAGWFAYDAGRQDDATALYHEALQAAILARDGALQARVWSNLAMQARLLGRDKEAVRIGQAAVETRQAKGDPWLKTLLHCRQAVGYARIGERPRAERSLARAESAYGRVSGAPDAWLSFLTPAEISGLAGAAHAALGRHARARDLTGTALETLESKFERNRAYYVIQRAQALLGCREVEGAVAEAGYAIELSGRLQSQRIQGKLRDLRTGIGRYRYAVPAAADFWDRTQGMVT